MRHNVYAPLFRFKRPLRLVSLLFLASATCFSSQESLQKDLSDWPGWRPLLKAGMWPELSRYFTKKPPQTDLDYLAYGLYLEKSRKKKISLAPVKAYLKVVTGKKQTWTSIGGAKTAINKVKAGSVTGFVPRLAAYKATAYLNKAGFKKVAHSLSLKSDFSIVDPINQKLIAERWQTGRPLGLNQAALGKLRTDLGRFSEKSALLRYRQAEVSFRLGQNKTALTTINDAISQATARWLLRSIAITLFEKNKLGSNQISIYNRMRLYAVVSKKNRNKLGLGSNTIKLAQTKCDTEYLSDCGLFLKAKKKKLSPFLQNHRSRYGQHPSRLKRFIGALNIVRHREIFGLFYRAIGEYRRKNKRIWQLYFEYAGNSKFRQRRMGYFKEYMQFLKEYPSRTAFDQAASILVQFNPGSKKPSYAPEAFWQEALTKLPDSTNKGRLYYWRYRQMRSQNRGKKARYYLEEFHRLAPDSFYNHTIWAKNSYDKSYKKAWEKVNSYAQFQRWLTRFGGQNDAIQFLKTRNFKQYNNPMATKLWGSLQAGPKAKIPAKTLFLYTLGELTLGSAYFKKETQTKAGTLARHKEKYFLGKKSGQKYVQLWHLKQLLEKSGLGVDVFAMPAGLLKELFPRPYRGRVKKAGRDHGVPEHAVYALMRQESAFRESAISRSNAMGLMQVLPSTGAWLARGLKVAPGYNLLHPYTSIHMGSKFISDLLRSQENFQWMAIAYNGGPGNLRKWRKRYYKGDFHFFLEKIPRSEPRHYCLITYQNFYNYNTIYQLY